jgi:hypothetical protein
MDLGVKFDLLKMKSLRVAFGAFLTSIYEVTDYTQRINSTEITSYDDGAAGNTAWNLTSRPRTNNEGEWRQTVSAETTNKDEVTTTQYSVPVGFEVPLSKKWTFRAGTTYSMAKIKTVARTTGGSVTTVTTETPAGAAATTTTSIGAPAGDYLNDSTTYTEAHQVTYRYGIQWDALDNLTIACNAFLDTNPNNAPAGTKASIFDLDTYRLLAIQAVFKF